MLSPRQAFEDNIRPAELLVRVYRLLENDGVETQGDLVKALRSMVGARADEELMLVANEIFLGLVRERAEIPSSMLKRAALSNLLRQAVVASCTALETYLPALLRVNLPTVIKAKRRDSLPQDRELRDFFKDLQFSLADMLRLIEDPDASVFIANKMLSFISFKYLSSHKGVHVAGVLLALDDPWARIGNRLGRDAEDCKGVLKDSTERRNDIVHRADRPAKELQEDPQDIGYAWTRQCVDTVKHVCLGLDELVADRMVQLKLEEKSTQWTSTT